MPRSPASFTQADVAPVFVSADLAAFLCGVSVDAAKVFGVTSATIRRVAAGKRDWRNVLSEDTPILKNIDAIKGGE